MNVTPLRIPGDVALEGALWHPAAPPALGVPAPGVVVAHPHPQRGGDMDNNVVTAIAGGLSTAGLGAITFNFRGVGGSEGAHEGGVGERADVLAALRSAATRPELDAARLGLAGYSFGALMSAAAAADGGGGAGSVCALALVSPPMRDNGVITHLAALHVPVLLLVGSADAACPSEQVERCALLPHVEVVVASGVDHFWWGREGVMAETVATFFARHLSPAQPA